MISGRDDITERAVALVAFLRGLNPDEVNGFDEAIMGDVAATEEALRGVAKLAIDGRVGSRRPDWKIEMRDLLTACAVGREEKARELIREMTPAHAALLAIVFVEEHSEEGKLLRDWLAIWAGDELGQLRPEG